MCIFSIAEYYTLPLRSCVSLIMLLNPLCLTIFTCKTKRLNDGTILKSLPIERWQDYQIQGNFCNQLYIPESSEVETLWLSFFPKCGITSLGNVWDVFRWDMNMLFSVIIGFVLNFHYGHWYWISVCDRNKFIATN